MKCMVMAVMLLLGAALTAQARSANSFIPARKSPTEFYAATATCDKTLVRPLTLDQPAYAKCMLRLGWRYIYIAPSD
jgi:hypothetical protein